MSELSEDVKYASEVTSSTDIPKREPVAKFAGLSDQKAIEVAFKYLGENNVASYLRIYLENNRSVAIVAAEMGIDENDARTLIDQLESQVAEAHLANVPRGYGHAASLLLIKGGKNSA